MRRTLWITLALLGCGEKEPTPDSEGDSADTAEDSAADDSGSDDTADSGPTDADGDGFAASADCDDADPAVYPGAEERCDGVDSDCDAAVDEDAVDAQVFYADLDGDGFGDPEVAQASCERPAGAVEDSADCDDGAADVYPGAPELCDDGVVNDCDGDAEAAFAACGEAGVMPLSGADALLQGPGVDRFGLAVSAAGDVNGDGHQDVLVGASLIEYSHPIQGSAYLFHGPITGTLGPEDAAAQIDGEAYEAYLGIQVAGPGDLNGDGVDDLVLGSMHSQLFLQDDDLGGSLFVFHGPATGSLSQSDADLELRVGPEHDHLGYVMTHGDVNDDGAVDLITGAPLTADSGPALAIFLGPHAAAGAARAPDITILNSDSSRDPGISMDVGDVDGDGVPDLIAGGHDVDQTGEVRIFLGPLSAGDRGAGSADVVIEGGAGELIGWSVAALEDHDGDGYGDLAAGARGNSDAHSYAGAVHLIPGPLSASGDAADLASGSWLGEGERHFAGETLRAAGDWDGDGRSDLLASSPDGERVYLVAGPSVGVASLGDALVVFEGDSAHRVSGGLGVAQLDADPWPELLLGGYSAGSSGQVYVFDGQGY